MTNCQCFSVEIKKEPYKLESIYKALDRKSKKGESP